MSSQYEEYDEHGEPIERPPEQEEHSNTEWAALRREKRERGRAEERATKAERELAFMRAGIDSSTNPMAAYFIQGYDGEVTADAIKAKAMEVGLLQAPPPPEPDPVKQAALQAGERIATTSQGGETTPPSGLDKLNEAYAQGGTPAMLRAAAEMGIPIQGQD